MPYTTEFLATVLFSVAVLHTFLVKRFQHWAHHFPEGSVMENLLHLLGEVEAVFLVWAGVLVAVIGSYDGWHEAVEHIDSIDFTEPMFVFVIMAIAATKPIVDLVDVVIRRFASLLPLGGSMGFLFSAIVIGPLLGSFITEPAAMTVTALVLKRQFFDRGISRQLKYALIGALFVHVSIGGTLTHFAAPPVVMVASKFGWDMEYMFLNIGWKALSSVLLYSSFLAFFYRKELIALPLLSDSDAHNGGAALMPRTPAWVSVIHVLTIAFVVINAHHPKMFMGGFVFFLGFCTVTREYQEALKLRDALLVGGFLAGLVVLGSLQSWWLRPLLASLGELELYFGTTILTAITDNAALTYLGSQVELSESMKYALVAGAVTGGGLTVIANAPNPAGYSILNASFGEEGISPVGLLLGAIPPTIVAIGCFLLLP